MLNMVEFIEMSLGIPFKGDLNKYDDVSEFLFNHNDKAKRALNRDSKWVLYNHLF
jgi:hypothetical protein